VISGVTVETLEGFLRTPSAAAAAPAVQAGAEEILLQPIKEISGTVKLPGSKSLSNRILLLAALSEVSGAAPSLSLPSWPTGIWVWPCGDTDFAGGLLVPCLSAIC